MFNYNYECEPCGEFVFEETRTLSDRHRLATCPKCGNNNCRKIMNRCHFNEIFPGSTKHESLAEHWTRESVKAQEEGFSSKDEIQTAIGLAQERAKQMGMPDKQLIGPVQSPYEGPKYNPTKEEVATAGVLVEKNVRARRGGDSREVKRTREALKEHEAVIKQKAKTSQTFKPRHDKSALQQQIKFAREARKA